MLFVKGVIVQKFGPEMKHVDQAIESYKWIIPVGNARSIISQLQVLNDTMKNESNLHSMVFFVS